MNCGVYVQFGHPVDISQAISLAIEFEAFDTANNADRSRKPRGELNMVQPASDDDDDDDDNDESGAIACTMTTVQSENFRKAKFDKNLSCRYCKKAGHSVETCFKLQNKKAWEAQQNTSPGTDQDQGN